MFLVSIFEQKSRNFITIWEIVQKFRSADVPFVILCAPSVLYAFPHQIVDFAHPFFNVISFRISKSENTFFRNRRFEDVIWRSQERKTLRLCSHGSSAGSKQFQVEIFAGSGGFLSDLDRARTEQLPTCWISQQTAKSPKRHPPKRRQWSKPLWNWRLTQQHHPRCVLNLHGYIVHSDFNS